MAASSGHHSGEYIDVTVPLELVCTTKVRILATTLWLCQNSYWKLPYIVDFPMNSMVDLSSSLCKRLPEAMLVGFSIYGERVTWVFISSNHQPWRTLIHCKAAYYGMDDHTIYTIFWPRHIWGSPKLDDFNINVYYIYTHYILKIMSPILLQLDFFLPRKTSFAAALAVNSGWPEERNTVPDGPKTPPALKHLAMALQYERTFINFQERHRDETMDVPGLVMTVP